MFKDQEQELERLGLALLEEEGERVTHTATGKKVRTKNTDGTDISPEKLSKDLQKPKKRHFPWFLLLLLLALAAVIAKHMGLF